MADVARLRGRSYVIKLGGEIMQNAAGLDSLAADISLLASEGVRVVVVHGGGPQADALAARLGHRVRKVAGRRVTDDDALLVAKMVYGGSTNTDLLAALKRHGARGVGVSGVDAGLITAHRRLPIAVKTAEGEEVVDFGHVGDIDSVDTALLHLLLGAGYVPVVASLAATERGDVLNVNADTVATALASALGADGLFLVTNVPGILLVPSDPSTLLAETTPAEVERLMSEGVISGGMLPKARNCLDALAAGIPAVCILDGSGERPPLLPAMLGKGAGTRIAR